MANEPTVAYGNTATDCISIHQPTPYEMEIIMKSKEEFRQGLFYSQEEVDQMVEDMYQATTVKDTRAFICEYFKVYYSIHDAYIEVEAVFDTRQTPGKRPY